MSIVESLLIRQDIGKTPRSVPRCRLLEAQGMEGDCRCLGGDRQICVMTKGIRTWMDGQTVKGRCFPYCAENILVQGGSMETWKRGVQFQVGESVIEITSVGTDCYPECERLLRSMDCRLHSGCCFARVIKTGTVQIGDVVKRVPKPPEKQA